MVDIDTSMPLLTHIIWDSIQNKENILGVIEIVNSNGILNENNKKINFKLENYLEKFCYLVNRKIKELLKNL